MNEEFPRLKELLDELKNDVPTRNPQAAKETRAKFLGQVFSARRAESVPQKSAPYRRNLALSFLSAALTVIVVLFSSGMTVYAAQDDLPNETLYPVKLAGEDARLWLSADTQAEIDLLMQFAQTRVDELVGLTERGALPPASVEQRLEQHIDQALQIAVGMNDENLSAALLQIHNGLQNQHQNLNGVTANEPVTAQAQTMLQTRLQQTASGITDPQGFRHSYRFGIQDVPTPAGLPNLNPSPQVTSTPNGNGNGSANGAGNGGGNNSGNGGMESGNESGSGSGFGNGGTGGGNGGGSGTGSNAPSGTPAQGEQGSGSGSGSGGCQGQRGCNRP